jgi:hypothetical protein
MLIELSREGKHFGDLDTPEEIASILITVTILAEQK